MATTANQQSKFNVFIVDDEQAMRENLQLLLEKNYPNATILAKCTSLADVRKNIGGTKPDFAFLDVELQDGTGFDVYKLLAEVFPNIPVIFVTAHNKYAVQAFKTSAVDYLLKPAQENEFIDAVEKALQKLASPVSNRQLQDLLQLINTNLTQLPSKISIMCTGGVEYVDPEEIIRIEANGNYTVFYNIYKDDIISTKLLKDYEDYLDDYNFLRIHSSHIINMKHISHISKTNGGYVTMKNQKRIPISKKYRNSFLEKLKSMGIQYV